MDHFGHFDGLSECIGRAIREHLLKANIDWPKEFTHPVLRVEAFLEDEGHGQKSISSRTSRIASVCLT
jgi:ATP-dependent RNA helicase DDX49/DBP8